MSMPGKFAAAVVSIVCIVSGLSFGAVKLPSIISDNMVLQADTKAAVWGWAEPGEKVRVEIAGQSQTTTADANRKWMLRLEPMKAGGPFEMTVAGENTITIKNVLIGEVWVGSGQSNMQWALKSVKDANEEIKKANYPQMRLFYVTRVTSLTPQADCNGRWEVCTPKTAEGFSAVAYLFGRDLHNELKVPVGLVHSSWGGTVIESWMSKEALARPELKETADNWAKWIPVYPKAIRQFKKARAEYDKEVKEAEQAGRKRRMKPPVAPLGDVNSPNYPSVLFNAMIAPLVPYSIKGVIWYQGESNALRADEYAKLFPAMIEDWRRCWGEGDFAFLFVQLANYKSANYFEPSWAQLREAQAKALELPKTAMATAIDIGEAKNIHPKNKQEVGRRLALCALAKAYGKDVEYSGPMYKSLKVEGNKAIVSFTHAKGLTAKGSEVKEVKIAGKDMQFVDANAVVKGETVIAWSEAVKEPAAVRYAWSNDPEGANLYNAAGLPAVPFRTDELSYIKE